MRSDAVPAMGWLTVLSRAAFCILGGAYSGALIVGLTLTSLAATAPVAPLDLLLRSAFLMIFTLPGSLIVLGLLANFRERGLSLGQSRMSAAACGMLIGGMTLGLPGPGFGPWLAGGFAGLATASCCIVLQAWTFPVRRADR